MGSETLGSTLSGKTIRIRRYVLDRLLNSGTDGRGAGRPVTSMELIEGCDVEDASIGEVGNAGRYFSREGSPEWCAYWGNEIPAHFGIRSHLRETAIRLRDVYHARVLELDRLALKEELVTHPSIENVLLARPSPAADVAYHERQPIPGMGMQNSGRGRRNERDDLAGDIAQFAPPPVEAPEILKMIEIDENEPIPRDIAYYLRETEVALVLPPESLKAWRRNHVKLDSRRVDAFVEALPDVLGFLNWAVGGKRPPGEVRAEWFSMTSWERSKVVHRLADVARNSIAAHSSGLAEKARNEEIG